MIFFRISFVFFAVSVLLFGQAQTDAGDLQGTVTDAGGGAIPGAKITVSDPVRGFSRAVETDEQGQFRVTRLLPGTYRVRTEANGFSIKTTEGVEIRVGDTIVLKIAMEVGAVNSELTVTAETPVVETARTQQASTIDTKRIENLPINRRNFLDFALQTPGVVETNDLVDGTDFRVVQSPQSGLSFGGGNGRGNGFYIDGGENYVNSGGVRPSVSQEAVREFQINRNSFTAEFGNAAGGSVNIITKSGTNEVHGDLFGFIRHRALQARNYFDPGKSAFTRAQYGATYSAPIRKDKTFLFAAFERLDRHETAFVPILQDRSAFYNFTPSQKALIDFLSTIHIPQAQDAVAGLKQALVPANNPATLALFNSNSGSFPFSENNNQLSGRIDHRFSDKDFLFFRGNYTKSFDQNSQFGALIGFNRGRSLGVNDATAMLSNTYILSSRWISETRLMFGYDAFRVHPTDPFGPEINIAGFGSFGREIYLPSNTFERHYQAQQNFDYSSGKHSVKFGFDINPVHDTVVSETFFSGRFQFGPGVPLGLLINTAQNDPNAATSLGFALQAFGHPELVGSLSDSITALQAYSLGVPLYYQQGFGDPNWVGFTKRYNFFLQDSYRYSPHLTLNYGLRYELEIDPKPIGTEPHNIAPRFGFAWSPGDSQKTVVRGGYGIYFARIDAQAANLPVTLNGTQIAQAFVTAQGLPGLINPKTGLPVSSVDIYQTLFANGTIGHRSISRADIAQFGLNPGPNSVGRVIFGIVPDFVNPYAHQASFEIEHAFGDYALSIGYEFNRGLHEIRSLDRNLYYATKPAVGYPTFGFKDPTILQNNVLESTANSFYHAMILQATKRFSHHVTFNSHYTFSKAIDETTDFNSDFQPQDQLNARGDRALSSFNQKHRFVANAVIDSGIKTGSGQGLWNNLVGDWTVAPIAIASSGRPFNLLAGFDVFAPDLQSTGDNHTTTHRPLGAGRNIGMGPAFYTFDLRLSRKFAFSEDKVRNVEFTAEGFNLLNHTNFKNINNTVGTKFLSDVPAPYVGRRGSPTEPLSFTSAFDPRQFQLGLKINF